MVFWKGLKTMTSPFQTVALVASPSYPNSVAWSDENLVAVASGHLVTILNPALPFGPRGLITIPPSKPFPIGVIKREDLLTSCLMPTCLSRDLRPCVRSISWSHPGLAPNAGCLLAVCSTEGRVKLYRQPFCEFHAEWVEVKDISDMLYDYLASINFGEADLASENSFIAVEDQSKRRKENNLHQISPEPKSEQKPLKKRKESDTLPSITAEKYASRSAMLSSLVVAWSPMLQLSSRSDISCNSCAVLAVGGKFGKVSFWRINAPQCYSIEHGRVPLDVILIGLLQAHDTWITTISWGLPVSDDASRRLILATGSSDGSVRFWIGHIDELLKSSEVDHASFSLFKEVIAITSIPVSVLSLTVSARSPHEMVLAVGKGSGCLEVWICDIHNCNFHNAGSYDAHDLVVTGLAWAFDGCCLFSCSKDNSVRSWLLNGRSLLEVPISSNALGMEGSADIQHVYDSCSGLALSPGDLVVAVVRSFDVDLLNPMYQARTQKAAVEFLWIGGQQVEASREKYPEFGIEALPGLSKKETACWESNILWSLKQYDHLSKPLVLWDVVAALSAFKQSVPTHVEHILAKWLSTWCIGYRMGASTENVLFSVPKLLPKFPSRKMHILNIMCRCVVLSDLKPDAINFKHQKLATVYGADDVELNPWIDLLISSERELRERLVAFSISADLSFRPYSSTSSPEVRHWIVGTENMEQWIAINPDQIQKQLKAMMSEDGRLCRRPRLAEEQCSICSAMVLFESAEVAFCKGMKSKDGVEQRHKLRRCAISMQVCPTTPLWFCMCCHRSVSKLAPQTLFTMLKHPFDIESLAKSFAYEAPLKPLCPFCGILLQRLQPDFLLSATPV